MDTSAPPAQYASPQTDRVLRGMIRRLRPVVASAPGLMSQTADTIVADLRSAFPHLVPAASAPPADAAEFVAQGRLRLGVRVDAEKLAAIRDYLRDRPVEFQDEAHKPMGSGLASAPPPTAFLGEHAVTDILHCPHLIDIANDPAVLSVVRAYLGFEPIIDAYMAWHSYAGRESAGSPQILHRDKDCFRFCKLFLYLSDVDEESGPHVYLPGSHRPDGFEQLYRMSTTDGHNPMQFFAGGQRNHAAYLEKVFADRFEHFTGPAGSTFLVNTYGLHKGMPPKSRNRMLFQVLYTLLPYSDLASNRERLPVKDLPVTTEPTPDFLYRNQLFLR